MSLVSIVAGYDEVCDEETGFCSVSPYLDPKQLLEAYPDILSDDPPENANILCPYLRLLERYGIIGNDFMPKFVSSNKILSALKVLGTNPNKLAVVVCLTVSLEQTTNFVSLPWFVNLEALHLSPSIAHDCAFTFAKGATVVEDITRNSTLSKLAELADDSGRLTMENIADVKYAICKEQGVEITDPEKGELILMYELLGGGVQGYIEYSDMERFLYTKLPMVIGEFALLVGFPEPSDE